MSIKQKILILFFVIADVILTLRLLLHSSMLQVLDPAGLIAFKERTLIITAISLMLTVAIPLFILTIYMVVRYRERGDNTKAAYAPNWTPKKSLQLFWWIVPTIIVVLLGILTWTSAHDVDPTKAIASTNKTMTIQVVALQWRWLFIYPEQHIATINYVEFPEKTPVQFDLVADGPMASFWIPRLGGQLMAMSSMVNKTHLIANTTGEYTGVNNEISGDGFARMRFVVKSTTQKDFDNWVNLLQQSGKPLTWQEYNSLAKPSMDSKVAYYYLKDNDLYNKVVTKYMSHNKSIDMEHMSY